MVSLTERAGSAILDRYVPVTMSFAVTMLKRAMNHVLTPQELASEAVPKG